MRIIHTDQIDPFSLKGWDRDQIYNGLDICGTAEALTNILPQLDPTTQATYDLERNLQGPVLEMRIRGCLIDQARKQEVIDEFFEVIDKIEQGLTSIVLEGVGMSMFNPRSTKDLQALFYRELGLPTIRRGGRPTVDRDAREHLEAYPIATQIVKHLNAITELGDKISVLRTAIDPDERIRTSYNIAGTSTGRFSSSLSEFGTGGNLQNIEESLRSILISDPGFKFAKFDGKSCQSRVVGAIEWNLFRDPTYLDVCESGDPHTAVAKLVWPRLGWTGDPKQDRLIADRGYYRHFSYRFMCKKVGHGTNFGGEPPAISLETKIPVDDIKQFQPRYFSAFPAHRLRLQWTEEQVRRFGQITSLSGRRRQFLKRRTDPKTWKEAAAYDPQETEAYFINTAMLQVWRKNIAIVMFQDHDALTFMYLEEAEDEVIPLLEAELNSVHLVLAQGREFHIPYDIEVGWNKGKYCCGQRRPECKGCTSAPNPDGLREYTGHDPRRRAEKVGVLDRVVSGSNRKPRSPKALAKVGGDQPDLGGAGTEGMVADFEPTVSESICDDNRTSWDGEDPDLEGLEELSADVE